MSQNTMTTTTLGTDACQMLGEHTYIMLLHSSECVVEGLDVGDSGVRVGGSA